LVSADAGAIAIGPNCSFSSSRLYRQTSRRNRSDGQRQTQKPRNRQRYRRHGDVNRA